MRHLIIIFTSLIFSTTLVQAQQLDQSFFNDANTFFENNVKGNNIDYKKAKNSSLLQALISKIEKTDLSKANDQERKAFYINAYNLLVVNSITTKYPINSVKEVSGFFDRKKHVVAGEKITLNKLESQKLIKATGDGRLHFVLVCGAVGCPPIVNFAYTPEKLDQQIEEQTRKALNDPQFIQVDGNKVNLSQIFKWYTSDFGGNLTGVRKFINKYRTTPLKSSNKFGYYSYNWQLNDAMQNEAGGTVGALAANDARYVVSAAIPKGSFEFKLFNNLYSQRTGSTEALTNRSTFFTTTLSALYGVNNRFNAGLEIKYRRVQNSNLPSSAFEVFQASPDGQSRTGITGIGPRIRFAPFKKLENFSIQSTFTFPIGENLTGTSDQPFIDWNGAIFNTQLFNDFSIGTKFSLFTEIDFLIEDIGSKSKNRLNRFSTPVTAIFSYFPNPKTTLYALSSYSPFYQSPFDYFAQGGLGAKYQFTSNFEVELLFTAFTNKFLSESGGDARTFNLGIRYNL